MKNGKFNFHANLTCENGCALREGKCGKSGALEERVTEKERDRDGQRQTRRGKGEKRALERTEM